MIARELLVKLGFNIDTAKFTQFAAMTDNIKAKMASVQGAMSNSLSPDINAAMQKISIYNRELQSLNGQERQSILELNKIEKQAIREVTQSHKQKHKELKALDDAALQRARKTREEYQNLIKGGKKFARTFTLIAGAAAAGFSLSLKNTLKDVKDFKTQEYHGEKTASRFDTKQIKAVDEFNSAFGETKKIITEIRNGFVIGLLPAITEITQRFQGWLKANKELIKIKLTSIIVGISKTICGLASAVGNVVTALGGWQRILSVVKVAIVSLGLFKLSQTLFIVSQNLKLVKTALSVGLNLQSLFSPVTLITAALAGLFLILEDFYVFSKGGKSVIGDIVGSDTWKRLEENIKMVTEPLEKLKELLVFLRDGKKGATLPFAKIDNPDTPTAWQNIKNNVSKVANRFLPENHKEGLNAFGRPKGHAHIVTDEEWGQHSLKRLEQKSSPQRIEQKPTYNMTINMPQGTTENHAELIAKTVRIELEKHTAYSYEQTMAAIGGT